MSKFPSYIIGTKGLISPFNKTTEVRGGNVELIGLFLLNLLQVENKKSFILYSDQRELFEHLPNDVAGELIKHIFSYVNDENPTTDNALVNLAFLSIKASLKRDLYKWQTQIKQRSDAGKKSALSRQRNSTSVNERTRKATDSVSVSVNVNEKSKTNSRGVSKETTPEQIFLSWFNSQKEKHTGKKGNFRQLSSTDVNNLKKLKSTYDGKDFLHVFSEMNKSKWVHDTKNLNPSHFLRIENFNRYIGQYEDEGDKMISETERIKKERGWIS